MFNRTFDTHQMTFALGEALAHLHALWYAGECSRSVGDDGVVRFAVRGGGLSASARPALRPAARCGRVPVPTRSSLTASGRRVEKCALRELRSSSRRALKANQSSSTEPAKASRTAPDPTAAARTAGKSG